MRTYIISRDEIKDMPVVAEGYKVFNYDWSTRQNNYMYADPNTGTAVGTIHKTEGDMEKCVCGSHFCVNPADCIKYYATLTWNKFAKVRVYGKVKGDNTDSKMAAEILEIVKEISFDELMEEIKKHDYAYGCSNAYGCYDVRGCYDAYFCDNCEGISHCICCTNFTGKLAVFNTETTEKEFGEIKAKILELSGDWYPKFNNAFDLYNKVGQEWEKVPADKIKAKSKKEAYADMPEKLKEYLKSLPQFNAEIWEQITGENA